MRYIYLVMSLSLLLGGGWMASGEWPRLGMTLLFLGLGMGGHGVRRWLNNQRPHLSLQGIQEEEAELLAESYQKAITDYRYLEQAKKQLEDRELAQQLGRMQHISHNMLSYLEKHPKKIPAVQRFIDYYQDRAVELVRKYQELEATELATERVTELKTRMKMTLSGFDEAYAEQFERLLNEQIITTDAELTVMEQNLDAQGIQLEQPESQPELNLEEEKQQGHFSLEKMMDVLEKEQGWLRSGRRSMTRSDSQEKPPKRALVRHAGWSIVPAREKSDVIKHKVIQSALAIFLGTFGAHKFYQGKTFWGFLYALFFWTSIPAWVGFVEGIRYLVMPLDDFYVQYYRKDDE